MHVFLATIFGFLLLQGALSIPISSGSSTEALSGTNLRRRAGLGQKPPPYSRPPCLHIPCDISPPHHA
ncbi:hypothetical protein PGT21_013583 [Puccinia graminis f. sp. tritici]|uniref:Uncharacterized protein n=1 Tax=Puccinia graminis f. sp. tritici TaxID=56615 RepID=A0A5B0P0F4_PUCGR|nr:hypothetical protein PGTUg99_025696 [Puccinia graminis f. sp. tritici]KAA1094214.1 hypothetical protein PGT21_013583 [Puccinia graminis f. sp. tritici]